MISLIENEKKINNLKSVIKQSIKVKMLKYDSYNNFYEKKIIRQILYNVTSSIVSKFKDSLFYDDVNEFLRRFYKYYDSTLRIKKINNFYCRNAKVFPNYMLHTESKYIYKNIIKKQRVIDCIQNVKKEIESEDEENEENSNHYNINKIINTNDFNSIMNQSLLTSNQDFPIMFFLKKNDEDSILSVENFIGRIVKAEENVEAGEKILNINEFKEDKVEEVFNKSTHNFIDLKESINKEKFANTQKLPVRKDEEVILSNTVKLNHNTISIDFNTIKSQGTINVEYRKSIKNPEELKKILKFHKKNTIIDKNTRSISAEIVNLPSNNLNIKQQVNNINVNSSNPFQFMKNSNKHSIDNKKKFKIFQKFSRQPIIKSLKKDSSNSSLINHPYSTRKNHIILMNDHKTPGLTRNSNSVIDLLNLPSASKTLEIKQLSLQSKNLNTISKKDEKENMFRTLTIRFEDKKGKEKVNNQVR